MFFFFQYKATDFLVPGPGKLEMIFTSSTGEVIQHTVNNFKSSGVALGMFNTDESIRYIYFLCLTSFL